MLFAEPAIKSFVHNEVTDTSGSSEILISIDAESREEVDEWAKKWLPPVALCSHSPAKARAGSMAAVLQTLTGTAGMYCIWIWPKCRKADTIAEDMQCVAT